MCSASTTPASDAILIGVDRLRTFAGQSFGGIPMAQYHVDLLLWERVLNDNPHVEAIVELGTWQGGFSWFLWAQAQARDLRFSTYDVVEPETLLPKFTFTKLDIYRYPEEVDLSGPLVLLCDGGNKPRELQTFPPLCEPGSVFVVHDWGTETLPDDVPDFLEELYGGFCDEIGSVSRVFRMRL